MKSLVLSYFSLTLLRYFFPLLPPPPPKTQCVILSKKDLFFSLSLSLYLFSSLRNVIDILSTGINSIELYIHTHTHALPIPHSIRLTLAGLGTEEEAKRGLLQEDIATRSRRPSRESTLKNRGVPGLYNWPPVNYTPRRASYKRKSIRHSRCQPTGVDNN